MKQLMRHEIYDSYKLLRVEEVEVDVPDIEEEIQSKEEELIKIYNEIQQLKEQKQ
jgi:hypothetical protein